MRIRKKPWAEPELNLSPIFIKNPIDNKNKWGNCFSKKQPLHIELGCGKGGFISSIASQNPNINYIAIDIKSDMLGYARRKIEEQYATKQRQVNNVLLTAYNIEQILDIFGSEDLVERIYINFCNPWPKARHRKRRLTHPNQLKKYKTFLKDSGLIYFKTDDETLYFDTIKYFEEENFEILDKTEDIHIKPIFENIKTEHEQMYLEQGIKIKAILAKK